MKLKLSISKLAKSQKNSEKSTKRAQAKSLKISAKSTKKTLVKSLKTKQNQQNRENIEALKKVFIEQMIEVIIAFLSKAQKTLTI